MRVGIIKGSRLGVFILRDRAWVDEIAPPLHGRAQRAAFAFLVQNKPAIAAVHDTNVRHERPLIGSRGF